LDRCYQLGSVERDKTIAKLRRRGWPLQRIGDTVGMSASGVNRALERMSAGRPGRPGRE